MPLLFVLVVINFAGLAKAYSVDDVPLKIDSPNFLSVHTFGAKCDGLSDDHDAIAAALQFVGGHGGGVAYFPPSASPCMLSRSIFAPPNTTLLASPGTIVLKATANNRSRPLLLSVGSNVTVDGLSFDGGGRDYPTSENVIQGYSVSNVTFIHIAVRHTRGIALVMSSNVSNSAVRDSLFEDIGNHWKTTHLVRDRLEGVVFCCGNSNSGNLAENNRFSKIGLDALQFSEQRDVTVSGNKFSLEDGQRRTVSAKDFGAAVYIVRVDTATIARNVITAAQGSCIDASALTDANIIGNTVTGCGSAGIGLFGSPSGPTKSVNVIQNDISNNGQWEYSPHAGGITLGGTVSKITISHNNIFDAQEAKTQKYGIYGTVGSTLTDLIIDGSNRVTGNAIAARGGVMTHNHLRDGDTPP